MTRLMNKIHKRIEAQFVQYFNEPESRQAMGFALKAKEKLNKDTH
jgi:hypothetical protein